MNLFNLIPLKEIFAQINPNSFVYTCNVINSPTKSFVKTHSIVHWAAENGYSHILKKVFNSKAKLGYVYYGGCLSGDYKTIKFLLQNGMSFDTKFYFESAFTCYKAVKPYLSYNFDNATTAAKNGSLKILKKCLRRNSCSNEQLTFLFNLSSLFGRKEITMYLERFV
jgi:hypothetical protein